MKMLLMLMMERCNKDVLDGCAPSNDDCCDRMPLQWQWQNKNQISALNVSRFFAILDERMSAGEAWRKSSSAQESRPFFLLCSSPLTGGEKHIWGIGQNCKIGAQVIVPWREKIFAKRNCAQTPQLVHHHVVAQKWNFKIPKCPEPTWGHPILLLESPCPFVDPSLTFLPHPTNTIFWCVSV